MCTCIELVSHSLFNETKLQNCKLNIESLKMCLIILPFDFFQSGNLELSLLKAKFFALDMVNKIILHILL